MAVCESLYVLIIANVAENSLLRKFQLFAGVIVNAKVTSIQQAKH